MGEEELYEAPANEFGGEEPQNLKSSVTGKKDGGESLWGGEKRNAVTSKFSTGRNM